MKDDEHKLMWEAYQSSMNEGWDEDDERDDAHSRAGLAPFSSTKEDDMFSPEEVKDTIDYFGEDVIKFAAKFLGSELAHPKVTSFNDIDKAMQIETISWVVDGLQENDTLPKRLDDREDERTAYKDAIDEYLTVNFNKLKNARPKHK